MHPALIAIPFAFFVMFFGTWFAHNMACSFAGGWGKLGKTYPAAAPPTEKVFPRQTGWLRQRVSYRGVLEVRLSQAGLYLSAGSAYRFGHPAVLVPWADLEVGADGSHPEYGDYTPVKFPKLDDLELRIYSSVRTELRKVASEGL